MSMIQEAMTKAMEEICRLGIAKSQKNTQQNYNFRGIDAAMSEMSPILVRNKITVTPRYSDLVFETREKDGGKFLRFASVKGAFTFSAADGSSVVAEVYGEAMDSGDKALTKAQSVAFRTCLFQTFVVPLMAMDPEADEYSLSQEHEGSADLMKRANLACNGGLATYSAFWTTLSKEERNAIGAKAHADFKAKASENDGVAA